MTKDEFVAERTRIISEMLDNPDKYGIYPTTKCFDELDALFDKLTSDNSDYTKCHECGDIYLNSEVQPHTGLCGYCNPPF